MAKKIKFALEMADGVKVRSGLEELREHFDMEKIAGHFLSGKLLEWLEDRYYDDEAAKIAELDKDAPNLNAQLCAIIGVDASKYDAFDVEALERLNEKKRLLKERTSDSKIIDNAMLTAFTQEDLADLLDLESPVIYLCGEKFNIPIRVEHKKYVGILGTPKIEIRASSNDDLKEKDILFENVILPWNSPATTTNAMETSTTNMNSQNAQTNTLDVSLIKSLLTTHFSPYLDYNYEENRWYSVEMGYDSHNKWGRYYGNRSKLTPEVKTICLRLICQGQYTDEDILHMHVDINMRFGWALTKDSFCAGGTIGNAIIPYNQITSVTSIRKVLFISTIEGNTYTFNGKNTVIFNGFDERLKNYLIAIRDLIGTPNQDEQHLQHILKQSNGFNFINTPIWMR